MSKKSILWYTFLMAPAGGRVVGLVTGSTLGTIGIVTGSLSQDSTQHDKEVDPPPATVQSFHHPLW